MRKSQKQRIFQILFVGGLSWLFAVILAVIGGLIFGDKGEKTLTAISKSEESFFERFLYNRVNGKCGNFHNRLVCVDISSIDSRKTLAEWIDTIYFHQPAAICLDVIHTQTDDIDTVGLLLLSDAIYRSRDKFVAPCFNKTFPYYYPVLKDSVRFATVALNDFFREYSSIDSLTGHYKFASAVIMAAENSERPIESKGLYINYRSKIGPKLNSLRELSRDSLIKDKVVLIGNFSGPADIHTLPIQVNGKEQLYGSEIHAYAISCLLADKDEYLSREDARYQKPYHKMGLMENGLFTFFLAIFYSALFIIISEAEDNYVIKRDRKRALSTIFLKGLFFYFYELAIFFGCILLSVNLMMIPNLLLFMASIFFVDIFNKTYHVYLSKNE